MSRVDRANRVVLFGFGLVLVAAGVYALVRSYGGLGDLTARSVVLSPDLRRFVGSHLGWVWLAALSLALLVAFAGLWWLRVQFKISPAVGEIPLREAAGEGRSVVDSAALEAALTEDICSYAAVARARSKLRADGLAPVVEVRVEVDDDVDIAALRQQIEVQALGRLRQALEVEAVVADVRFELSPAARKVS